MNDNRKSFEHLVFEIFKNEQTFDKTHYQLMRSFDLMNRKVKSFKSMTLKTQYDICNTACLMAMGASLRQLRMIEILSRNKPVNDIERDYCPEYGFKEPNPLIIKEDGMLNK
jgi:hypothetical protein